MLEYGDAFLEQNKEALKHLQKTMSPGAFAVAMAMAAAAANEDEAHDEEELEEA